MAPNSLHAPINRRKPSLRHGLNDAAHAVSMAFRRHTRERMQARADSPASTTGSSTAGSSTAGSSTTVNSSSRSNSDRSDDSISIIGYSIVDTETKDRLRDFERWIDVKRMAVCYRFNSEMCRGRCYRRHVCVLCEGDHPIADCLLARLEDNDRFEWRVNGNGSHYAPSQALTRSSRVSTPSLSGLSLSTQE